MSRIVAVHPAVNLLERLVEDIISNNHLEDALIIFPHRRAIAFTKYYLSQKIDSPKLTPEMYSFEDWVKKTYSKEKSSLPSVVESYDQAWISYKATERVYKEEGKEPPSWERFFGWGLKIAELFKEFDLELKEPKDLINPSVTLSEPVRDLLERIRRIYRLFKELLKENNLTTYPMMVRALAEEGFSVEERPTYIVGFYALTKAEEEIFKRLFNNGATVYWHVDPESLEHNDNPLSRWMKRWGIKPEIVDYQGPTCEIHFYEAADLHSEIEKLKQFLGEDCDERPDKRAVVLLDQKNLIPVALNLPEIPVNITMGYPFKHTGLFSFLKSLFTLAKGKDDKRGYRTQHLIELLGYPYVEGEALKEQLYQKGSPYLRPEEIIAIGGETAREILETLVVPVESAKTLKKLCEALLGIFNHLLPRASSLEKDFMAKVAEEVLVPLSYSLFAERSMDLKTLSNLFEQVASNVSLPFEGEPLTGLQVMGLLETRLLSFEEVYILDANEDVIPGVEEVNPLAPREVRRALQLPDRYDQEVIAKYHFERLIRASKKAHILWQSKLTPSKGASLESKKVKSRFVERLLWEIEKREKEPAERLIEKCTFEVIPPGKSQKLIDKAPMAETVRKLLKENISPSMLQAYLNCPLMFYYQRVLKLSPQRIKDEVPLDELGNIVHQALFSYFNHLCGESFPKVITKNDVNADDFLKVLKEHLHKSDFYKRLSKARRWLLWEGVFYRLTKYLKENFPEKLEILGLEKELTKSEHISEVGEVILRGIADRIDKREGITVIVDYKTGTGKKINFNKLLQIDVQELNSYGHEELKVLAQWMPEIQLPFYVYLYSSSSDADPTYTTASYVNLESNGEEAFLIEPQYMPSEQLSQWMKEVFPNIISFILRHILESEYWFPAVQEGACRYCAFNGFCRYSSA